MARRPGLTPERVVDVAVEIADEGGLETVTLARIAERLGVRTPSLYNHVAGLDDVRRSLTVRAIVLLGQRLQRAAVGRSGPDAVRAMAVAYRDFAKEHPGLAAAVVPTTEVEDPAIRSAGADTLAVVLAALSAYDLGERDSVHAARTFRSAVHGFVSLELAGGFGLSADVDESFAWMVDLVVRGLHQRARSQA